MIIEPFWAFMPVNVFLYIIMSSINIISKIIVLLIEIHNNKFFTMVIDSFILRATLQSGWMPSILNPCFIVTERVKFNTLSPAFYHVSSRARGKKKTKKKHKSPHVITGSNEITWRVISDLKKKASLEMSQMSEEMGTTREVIYVLLRCETDTGLSSVDLQPTGRYVDHIWKNWNCEDKLRLRWAHGFLSQQRAILGMF